MRTNYHKKAFARKRMEALEDDDKRPSRPPLTDLELHECVLAGRQSIQTLLVSRKSPDFERFADAGIESLRHAEREILRRVLEAKTTKRPEVVNESENDGE